MTNLTRNTFRVVTRLKIGFGSSRSVIPNLLDEPDAMAPTAPSETVKYGLKRVLGHNSAHMASQKLSFGDSESSRRARRDGTNESV